MVWLEPKLTNFVTDQLKIETSEPIKTAIYLNKLVALNSNLPRSGITSANPESVAVLTAVKGGAGGGGRKALLAVLKAVIPSNMMGQDLSPPAVSYTLPKSTFSDHPIHRSQAGQRESETDIHTLSSSAAAVAVPLRLLLLLYIWFEGGSIGWLDGAVRDRPVLT